MSQLNPLPPNIGIPEQFLVPGLWEAFVQIVLEVTVQAYRNMREKHIVQQSWEEDHFTINLEDCIRPLAFKHPMNITVVARTKTHTVEMKSGEVTAKRAKEIDIKLWGRWEKYNDIYFAWECKKIASRQDDEKYKDLINEYIKEGMFRFLDEEYSTYLGNAGMLGYVLAGSISDIVKGINQSMTSSLRERRLDETNNLYQAPPIDNFSDIYYSSHKREVTISTITLHHLFLTFDFK